jgi:hypothetical protein
MLYPRTSDEIWQRISGIYVSQLIVGYVQINSSIDFFFLDKSNMVNDVAE